MLLKQRIRATGLSAILIVSAICASNANAGAMGRPGANMPGASAKPAHKAPRVGHGHRRHDQRRAHRHRQPVVVNPAVPRNGAWLGPVNSYFERGTGTGVSNNVDRVHGRRAMPPLDHHDRHNARAPGRAGFRDNAGSVGNPNRLSPADVRRLQSRLPARQRHHRVNRKDQWAQRDSAGVRFGPPASQLPQALSTADQAGAVLHGRINDRRRNTGSPVPGNFVRQIGAGHKTAVYRSRKYMVANSVWYRPWNGRFKVVVPPVGLTITTLPTGFASVRRDGVTYYSANGVYLRAMGRGGYIVVSVPL